MFHLQPVISHSPTVNFKQWDSSYPSGASDFGSIGHHQMPKMHSGNHHGNCCTRFWWSSRKPGWIMVPSPLSMHLWVWLTHSALCSCDVKIAMCSTGVWLRSCVITVIILMTTFSEWFTPGFLSYNPVVRVESGKGGCVHVSVCVCLSTKVHILLAK